MTNQNNIETNLLNEIFIKPSQEIKTDRFSVQTEAAPCSGTCSSGACRSISD